MCRFLAKKAGLAGKTEEEEIFAGIIQELVVQLCGKESWPSRKSEEGEFDADIIPNLVV